MGRLFAALSRQGTLLRVIKEAVYDAGRMPGSRGYGL
jgi:hypothetical protein